ncbi:MAG TPA: hypothetical protein VFZ97_19275 [Acidimicrobiales bacterium]
MFDQFKTEPPPPRKDMADLRRYSEERGRWLRRRSKRVRASLAGAGLCAAVAAVVVPLTTLSGSPQTNVAVSKPTTPTAATCTAEDVRAQRSAAMPAPRRATESVQLNSGRSADLLPAQAGVTPQVPAESAWATANLPTAGGGRAAIVFGIYPTATAGSAQPSTPVWLVYASDVALTDGYVTGGPPIGVQGTCQFGYVKAVVNATTGAVMERGAGLY